MMMKKIKAALVRAWLCAATAKEPEKAIGYGGAAVNRVNRRAKALFSRTTSTGMRNLCPSISATELFSMTTSTAMMILCPLISAMAHSMTSAMVPWAG